MADKFTGMRITLTKDGPYLITGSVPVEKAVIGTNADGESWEWGEGEAFEAGATYALCRCGQTSNAPFCDGSHVTVGFDGTETASREPYDAQKRVLHGPGLTLEDAQVFCAGARFCDAVQDVWTAIRRTDDPGTRDRIIGQVARCPSGRLVAVDKLTGEPIEPELQPSINVVEDPAAGCSGPLWVRGGVEVQSQGGEAYEVRNRVTLCRCGQSGNKPFCDGTHVTVGFRDGLL